MGQISIKNKQFWEGKVLSSNNFGDFLILEYLNSNCIRIKFIRTGSIIQASLGNIKKGCVLDPMQPTVYNIGYLGIGKYHSRNSKEPQFTSYKRWKEMLNRCYNKNCSSYKNYGAVGAYVCDEWLNYQNYAEWWEQNCLNENFVVDKDILHWGNKVYGPEFCCFIPTEINACFTFRHNCRGEYPIGVRKKGNSIIAQINCRSKKIHLGSFNTVEEAFKAYKKAKENQIKELAEQYKEQIAKNIYNTLINFQISIND